jgi:hypothetical protein
MKKSILLTFLLLLSASFIFASPQAGQAENLIVPQSDNIYNDLYIMAGKGYISSVDADHFRYSPITTYEAAKYVCEALLTIAAAPEKTAGKKADIETLRGLYETYKTKAGEIYGKTNELKDKIKEIENLLATADLEGFKEVVSSADAEMFDIEQEYKLTTFRGVPPFKVMGMLNVRWQDVQSLGVSHIHHTSLGGTFMQLWTEGIVTNDVSYKLNLTFERPANEAEKNQSYLGIKLPEYWGTGQRFLDKYTINMTAFGWRLASGFFWDDITPFIAKQILTERPVLFDRDPYALEETARGHYENVFLHSFTKRGDIWSKHPWMGLGLYNMNLFGSQIKVFAGKAEKFEELYDKLFLYEFGGRWTYPLEVAGIMKNSQVSANFYSTSPVRDEIMTLMRDYRNDPKNPNNAIDKSFGKSPDSFMQWQNIGGADFKVNLFEAFSVAVEYEHSDYHGRILKNSFPGDAPVFPNINYIADPYYRQGNAVYGTLGATISIIKLEAKYTQIDPDYVATASAVLDTTMPTKTDLAGVNPLIMKTTTYAGDPTMLWNNMKRLSIFGNITIPNGYILVNYGKSEQIKLTGRELYLEHFLIGNRLTGSLYWQLFYSNYGYPDIPNNMGIEYNAYNDLFLTGVVPNQVHQHKMITDKWLTNKELILSNYAGPDDTKKYYNNVSLEFRYALNKLVGLENNLFVQAYAELAMLTDKNDFTVNFSPDELLSQQIITAFAVYNLTKKINVMVEWGIERWVTNQCDIPLDEYDTSYGVGFDYDFAPRTAIFLRVKRFTHDDKVMPAANFNGWQLFMELKNFF